MLDNYFKKIDEILKHELIRAVECQKEKRAHDIGLIQGKTIFNDQSELHFMEYIVAKEWLEIRTYAYHYQDSLKKLIFRYDNRPHHPEISSFPHHKHLVDAIVACNPPSLQWILDEILDLIQKKDLQ